jgi:hypothetical protein
MTGVKAYVIYDDARKYYFKALALGMFWECTTKRDDAKEFSSRAAASKKLTESGKHRQGWRVVPVTKVAA